MLVNNRIHALSAVYVRSIYALVKDARANVVSLVLLDGSLEARDRVYEFSGSRGFILWGNGNDLLVAVDDSLFLVSGNEAKLVLRARPGNFFWHAAEAGGKIFVHEYGEPPAGIYASEDLKHWVKVVDNTDVDKRSRHFHFIGYDPYRDWLIATLGDANPVRAVYSTDFGASWRRLYVGPWQFVPFFVLKDRIVFGMDSDVAKGGVGVYLPADGSWKFRFLKFIDSRINIVQFSSLMRVGDFWVAALGAPKPLLFPEIYLIGSLSTPRATTVVTTTIWA